MSMTVFAPDVFGASILDSLRDVLVFGGPDVVTRDHDDDLGLDQAKRFEFKVDDADTAEHVLPIVASEVARALANEVDQFLASQWVQAANSTASARITEFSSVNVIDHCLLPLSSALSAAGVTTIGRYVVIPPALYFILRRDSRFTETSGPNGLVGTAYGFDVHMSNHCAQPYADTYAVLAGVAEAINLAERVDEVEVQRSSMSPDLVRGVARYGCHVAKPDALACCQVSVL